MARSVLVSTALGTNLFSFKLLNLLGRRRYDVGLVQYFLAPISKLQPHVTLNGREWTNSAAKVSSSRAK